MAHNKYKNTKTKKRPFFLVDNSNTHNTKPLGIDYQN